MKDNSFINKEFPEQKEDDHLAILNFCVFVVGLLSFAV